MSGAPQLHRLATARLNFVAYSNTWLPGSALVASVGADGPTRGRLALHVLNSAERTLELRQQVEHGAALKAVVVLAGAIASTAPASSSVSKPKNSAATTATASAATTATATTASATTTTSTSTTSTSNAAAAVLLATGDFEGRLCVWDASAPALPVWAAQAHSSIVNALASSADAPHELAAAGRDGRVTLWDVRVPERAVLQLAPRPRAAAGSSSRQGAATVHDCWAVCFAPLPTHGRCLAAGYDDGTVAAVDLRAGGRVVVEQRVDAGVCSLVWASDALVAATTASKVCFLQLAQRSASGRVAELASAPAQWRIENQQGTVWAARPHPARPATLLTCGSNGSLLLYSYSASEAGGSARVLVSAATGAHPVLDAAFHPANADGLLAWSDTDRALHVGLYVL